MSRRLYPRLAWDGLRKNRRLAWPYLLTCVCMVAMLYILSFLASADVTRMLPHGASSVEMVLTLGQLVIALFSLIFLFYTYSFLLRRRAREFGLYNVLGMSRWNLARVVAWENAITAMLSLAGGLALGVGVSKLAELGLMNLVGADIDYRLRVNGHAMLKTALAFLAIFGILGLTAVRRTLRGSAVSLMKAESVGEKPPKGNWMLAILGLILLGAAYWLAVSVNNPLDALLWFFVAVLLVIVATYLLMISGSVKLCRLLQQNRAYYYQPRHFVSVSSMAYRMKRNGAGLASICIIATMVLVLLSATTCLWFGTEDALDSRYPREINVTVRMNDAAQLNDANLDRVRECAAALAGERGASIENVLERRGYVSLADGGSPLVGVTADLPDPEAAVDGFGYAGLEGQEAQEIQFCWIYDFDTGLTDAENEDFGRELSRRLEPLHAGDSEDQGWGGTELSTRAYNREDYYGSNGALFFIGIVLSAVFLLAAVLIIYYKQVSEGYEDARRFDIMRKVGMTRREIRASISSQLLTVFALPLALAGLHLTFAFPMIRRVLLLFGLTDTSLFVRTTLISFAVFAAFYAFVYRLTSGVYYRIVSGTGEE